MSDHAATDTADPDVAPQHLGHVDGAIPSDTNQFTVALADDAVVQLDDLVAVTQTLPGPVGLVEEVTHFGIVTQQAGLIEGAQYASDTARIAHDLTMPGQTSRRATVTVLRTIPELWLAPEPGAPVRRAAGAERVQALFADQMDGRLPVGLDQSRQPVWADFSFMDGTAGGHVNITGVSGVATKTSYATFLLYMLFETEQGRQLLGTRAAGARALLFNVKGEDLLHLDRPNLRLGERPGVMEEWAALGVDAPGPFGDVGIFAPRSANAHPGSTASDVSSRPGQDITVYGWTPWEFIRQGLLRFCFTSDDDVKTQVTFVEQRVRVQLARHAYPAAGRPGAVVLAAPQDNSSFNFDRVINERRGDKQPSDGTLIESFSDLVDFLMGVCDPTGGDPGWTAGVNAGTLSAFLRRLMALTPRMGQLVDLNVTPVGLDHHVTVVDIHSLHDSAQRFVVGALLDQVFAGNQGSRRDLRYIVLDELNKYAPREGRSPLKELLVDIAERGRSLGVLLIGAQQSSLDVAPAIVRNAALKVAGRLDASEAGEYKFLSPELRQRAYRFLPGTMVLDQPMIPAPIPLRFPFPGYATNVREGGEGDPARAAQDTADAFAAARGELLD
jgi:uncharacterized protein